MKLASLCIGNRDKMKTLSLVFIFIAALILISGCGTGDSLRARNALEASKAAYERCLEQNSGDPFECQYLKRKYEADLKAYREASEVGKPTTTIRFGIASEN
jgi:hypothetical protein